MTQADEAVHSAYAMVTASLNYDYEACREILASQDGDAVYLAIALSRLAARVLEILAVDREVEVQKMWSDTLLNVASSSS